MFLLKFKSVCLKWCTQIINTNVNRQCCLNLKDLQGKQWRKNKGRGSKGRRPFQFNPSGCWLFVLAVKQKQLKRKLFNGCAFLRESRGLSPDNQETLHSWSFNLWPWKLLWTQSSGDTLCPLTSKGRGEEGSAGRAGLPINRGRWFHHIKCKFGKHFHTVTWVPMWQVIWHELERELPWILILLEVLVD